MKKPALNERQKLDLVCECFRDCFAKSENTVLAFGYSEPMYLPATATGPAIIQSTHDYLSSALHEIAHWCIAGPVRRQRVDFGYWYQTDGRNAVVQRSFEKVEVKPQALEAIFSKACYHRFNLSADNLTSNSEPSSEFAYAVSRQIYQYLTISMPKRARVWLGVLEERFSSSVTLENVLDQLGHTATGEHRSGQEPIAC